MPKGTMKRLHSVALFCLLSPIAMRCQRADVTEPGVESGAIVRIATALNHLTVLEFHEPVTMAAAGSSDFQIERESNKVFVKPVKPGVSTDLFVWTASRRFAYELETTEEVKKMNFTIDNAPAEVAKSAPSMDADQVADVVLTSALLGSEEITPPRSKSSRKQVSIRIERVFRTRTTLYIHYEITNDTSLNYQFAMPKARQLQPTSSTVPLSELLHSQLDAKAIDRFAAAEEIPLPVAHSESEVHKLEPGQKTQGVIAIRRDLKSPTMVELAFDDGVKAVVVL
jgi:hypothetical protein